MAIPGPGKYIFVAMFAEDAPKFSITGKGKYQADSCKNYPGPGAYQPKLYINPDGKFFRSSYGNIRNIPFGTDRSQRSKSIQNSYPGPGHYQHENLILGNSQRINFNSKFNSPHSKTITGKPHDVSSQTKYPGPGTYQAFSEWGIYAKPVPIRSVSSLNADEGDEAVSKDKNKSGTFNSSDPTRGS